LPIGFAYPQVQARKNRGRWSALAKLEGLQLHPVPFRKIRGDAAELSLFPLREGDTRLPFWPPLALAQARKTEAFAGRI
jgi:hypothetical protein